ncbi:MAG: STT3 domain-containing protein [Methanobacterium sp.]|jgi:dolichyl-diphosphooligosaccharide--protein glycosyltransferase
MNANQFLSKSKPLIIIILLFSAVFLLRAHAVQLSNIPDDQRPFFQDQYGQPYFSEMDSYYNYRMTRNYLENGHLGDTIINGTQWDNLSYYPEGRSAEYPPLIAYITAYIYKFLNMFSTVPLTTVAIWTAPVIASLCVIPAYLFIKRLSNDYGGIAAALLVATAPAYFARTFAGFFDTDMFNVTMPILVVWFFIESMHADSLKNRSIFMILAAVSMFLFSMAWEGWWYMFYIVTGAGILYLLASNYLFKMKTVKHYPDKITWFKDQKALFTLLTFIVASSILIMFNLGVSGFFTTLIGAFGFVHIHLGTLQGNYPNVLVSVGELQIPTIHAVINNTGAGAFILGILCVPLLIWKFKPDLIKSDSNNENKAPKRKTKPRRRQRNNKSNVKEKIKEPAKKIINPVVMEKQKVYLLYIVLFSVWILLTAYTVTRGIRFIQGFSIPMGLGAGLFIGLIAPNISKYVKNAKYCAVAMLVIIAVFSGPSLHEAYRISDNVFPGTNDAMYSSLEYIRDNTSPDTVITSWWDFGHLFAAAAERPVTFDGGSQNTPRAFWVGRALLTDNENLSAGILRMLTTSGDRGFLTLENYTKDTGKSVEILDRILPVSRQNAQTILINEYNFTSDQAAGVLKYTHPDNPNPHVFITSSDMLHKAAWWSYFGGWNFQNNTGQHYIYNAAHGTSQNVNGSTVITAPNGVVAEITDNNITAGLKHVQGIRTQVIEPHNLKVVLNNQIVKDEIVSTNSPISIILIVEHNSSLAIVMNRELEDSMFTRMFLFGGAGLSRFRIAHEQPGVTVWNVT